MRFAFVTQSGRRLYTREWGGGFGYSGEWEVDALYPDAPHLTGCRFDSHTVDFYRRALPFEV